MSNELSKPLSNLSLSNSDSNNSNTSASLLLAWQVKDKHCLVIGGGEVAYSRIVHLIRANAKITIITGSTNLHPEIIKLNQQNKFHLFNQRDYKTSDLTMYENLSQPFDVDSISKEHYKSITDQVYNQTFAIVCCCIDDYDLSELIYYQCKFLKLPVNIADKPPLCDFYFGSMINQDNLQIMISTNGKSPRLSKIIKDSIAKEFENVDLNKAIENLGMIRSRLREMKLIDDDLITIETRMTWIKNLTDFFSLKQWSELNLIPKSSTPPIDNRWIYIDKIINYFPNYPPNDYELFKESIYKS